MNSLSLNLVICYVLFAVSASALFTIPYSQDEYPNRNGSGLITSKGYPCEEHEVETEDGYILTMQRIPHGISNKDMVGERPVVFLQHGLLDASTTWILNSANQSLGFILADRGYDVWLGNVRGNRYSLKHRNKTMTYETEQFWDFSWDEMAKYDLKAMINYALKTSKTERLSYIGHSQGTLIMFAQLSVDKELAKKIKLFVAMGPVAMLGSMKSQIANLAGPSPKNDDAIFTIFGRKDFFLKSSVLMTLTEKLVCGSIFKVGLCSNLLNIIMGSTDNLNQTRLPVYISHAPAGSSVKNLLHYSQAVYSKNFQMFDYGKDENIKRYNQATPPQFDAKKVEVPVFLAWGENDWLADPADVLYLRNNLPNVVKDMEMKKWNHVDFVWGTAAAGSLYKDVLTYLQKYIN